MKRWIIGLAALGLIVAGEDRLATAGTITVVGDTITIVEGGAARICNSPSQIRA